MATNFKKSLFWLTTISGLGYGLLIATSPSAENIEKISKSSSSSDRKEISTKNQQFANVLLAASGANKPIYRLNKEQVDKELRKD